ncbi:MAG: carboxypeptidase regulatory-like domain-containing protein, partial [Acidobacteriales bacterium]
MSRAWLCAIALLLASYGATAARECAGISGAVSAASGEPAPLAELTLVNLDSGVETQVVADLHGKYQISRLPAGRYAVIARAAHTSVSTTSRVVVTGGPCVELPIILSTMPAVLESGRLR